jgi:serine/threonine protein kinase
MSDLVQRHDLPTRVGNVDDTALPVAPEGNGGADGLPTIEGFDILGRLGAGAMGEVYQARSHKTGEEVALKVMAPALMDRQDLIKRFEREIALLSKLRHPNIACATESGKIDGRLYLAMEFVRGPTLSNLLKVAGAFSEVDVLRIAIQIAKALEYAWTSSGLIHRDIKPSNLLAVPESDNSGGERVKIIDFGLARATDSDDMSMTMTGMVMGTPNYMSTEQIRGEKELGPQADMYALGCTLFQLLTGRLPYPGNAPAQVMAAHLKEAIPDPGSLVPSLTPATRHLVMTCMAKEPGKRYASYTPLINACDAALRTITLRDTTSIRLLRRPLVLSRPTKKTAAPIEEADQVFKDDYETARLRRKVKEKEASEGSSHPSSYEPSTDQYGADVGSDAPAPKHMRPGSATEALAKAATERFNRNKSTTSIHRKKATAAAKKRQSDHIPIPTTSVTRRQMPKQIAEPPAERHLVAWIMVIVTLVGFVAVAVRVL